MESPTHNVGAWTARRAAIGGEHVAIADGERSLDYAALHDRTLRCAAVLAEAGIGRGDRVALVLGNRTAYLEGIFAAARLGAIAVPMNVRLTAPEIGELVGDCTPGVVVHESSLAGVVEAACERAGSEPARLVCGGEPDAYERALARAEPLEQLEPVTPDDPLMIMYTSGTTGVAKGALLPHRKTLFNSLNAQLFFDLTKRDRVLVALPLFHSFGLAILSLPTLYAGGTVHLHARFDPHAVWETVARERITFFGGVPTMFRALLEALDETPDLDTSSLRFLFTAGAAISVDLIRAFEQRGLVLKQGFGQTETSILCCLDARDAIRKAGSVGRPVFHADVRVVRLATLDRPPELWEGVAPGEAGEIVVRGPITQLGYWNRPEATAQSRRGEWHRTGDLATIDAGGFLTLSGRARDMYISGGENVYPAEIERVFAEHPAVREMAVVAEEDPRWGEVGRAYVIIRPGATFDPAALRAWGAARLASFKLPRSFVRIDELPRTETGKVQKHRLGGPPDPAGGSHPLPSGEADP